MTNIEATRKSIRKVFVLGQVTSRGFDNPLTVHAIDNDLFAAVWSFSAELTMVDGELTKSTKEKISKMVSQAHSCPICVKAHQMVTVAAEVAENNATDPLCDAAMAYAVRVLTASREGKEISIPPEAKDLSDKVKAEVALNVLLVDHTNRVVNAILGEEMSTAMFGVPRGVAKTLESPGVMGKANRVLSHFLKGGLKTKHKTGFTRYLFKGESNDFKLPEHLKGAELVGKERARALSRWVSLVDTLYATHVKDYVTQEMISFVDDPSHAPPETQNLKLVMFELEQMRAKVREASNENQAIVTTVLLLLSYASRSLFQSSDWNKLVEMAGNEQARRIACWWSMRWTLKRIKGLSGN